MMYKLTRNIVFMTALLGLGLTSCGDYYPGSKEEPYDTDLKTVKITNAGADGSTVVSGTIDEANKMINFPRLDVASNFSAIKVDAEVSEGAQLQQSSFDFSMADDEVEKTLILRVINHKRYKDYFIKVRKNIPVYGADFTKPTVYNYSGDHIYADFTSLLTRSAAFDGNYVLIVSRAANKPHLLKVSDLIAGTPNPIPLDLTGVSGGTYSYNQGALANGHIYIATLSGSKASPLKIYYWDTPNAVPETIANINVANIPNSGNRYGDNMSVSIDKNGNGYIFFGDNASTSILRLSVTNHKTIDNPVVLPSNANATAFMNINCIEGTSQYVWSGVRIPVTLTDESVNVKYAMNAANIASEAIDPRIFTFNNERYLMVCTAGLGSASKATPTIYVYNITRGNTIEDALKIFDNSDNHNPVYSFALGGSGNSAPSAQTGYYVEKDANGKDSKLYIFGARSDSGFAISSFPIKQQDDN